MTRFTKDVIDAPHTQREMASIPHQGNTLKGFKSALDDLGAIYHGTPHHQAASLAAKDAEISQLASALNKAKEENERLRVKLGEIVATLDGEPEYHYQGMGCGLEDRNITDRYDAMEYGWDQAMERIFSEHINHAVDVAKEALK